MVVVSRNDVPYNANILTSRFVQASKGKRAKNKVRKARCFIQGHEEKYEGQLVQNIIVVRQQKTILLVAISAVLGFKIFSADFTQLCTESTKTLQMKLFINL